MKRINGHREFKCLIKPSDSNVQQEKTEKAIALAIIRSLVSNNKLPAEQLVKCEKELRKIYSTKKGKRNEH